MTHNKTIKKPISIRKQLFVLFFLLMNLIFTPVSASAQLRSAVAVGENNALDCVSILPPDYNSVTGEGGWHAIKNNCNKTIYVETCNPIDEIWPQPSGFDITIPKTCNAKSSPLFRPDDIVSANDKKIMQKRNPFFYWGSFGTVIRAGETEELYSADESQEALFAVCFMGHGIFITSDSSGNFSCNYGDTAREKPRFWDGQ